MHSETITFAIMQRHIHRCLMRLCTISNHEHQWHERCSMVRKEMPPQDVSLCIYFYLVVDIGRPSLAANPCLPMRESTVFIRIVAALE